MCIIMTILGLVMIISDDREVSKSNKEAKNIMQKKRHV